MIDSKYRNLAQPTFDLLARGFVVYKISPNTISLAALVIGISSGIAIGFGFYLSGLVLLWLSGLLDVLDGSVARLAKQTSALGAYFDLIFDRLVEASVILGLYASMPESAWPYLLFFVAVLFNFTTFMLAGTLFQNQGVKSMHYDSGLAERTEAFLVFSAILLFPTWTTPLLLGFNAVIFFTGCQRMVKIIRFFKEGDTENV